MKTQHERNISIIFKLMMVCSKLNENLCSEIHKKTVVTDTKKAYIFTKMKTKNEKGGYLGKKGAGYV